MRNSILYLAIMLIYNCPLFATDVRSIEEENPEFCEDHVLTAINAWGNVDPRGLINIDTPLFSELLKFEANKLKDGIEITWETAEESGLDYFDLSRSLDGQKYESIYTVKGAGTTKQKSIYQYLDAEVYQIAKDATQVSYQLTQVGYNEAQEEVGETSLLLLQTGFNESFLPQVTPKSPNVAAMQRFGNFPVSLYTGIPQIEIPIYDIQVGDVIIPVKLVYHAATKWPTMPPG